MNIETITKVIAVIAGLAYAAGLLIVNLHLARYGVFAVDLARAEYVLAGTTWLFVFCAAYGAVHYARARLLPANGATLPPPKRLLQTLKYVFVSQVMTWLPLNLVTVGRLDIFRWEVWVLLTIMLVGYLSVDYALEIARDGWRSALPDLPVSSEGMALRSMFFVVSQCVAAVVFSIAAYAFLAYPEVPQVLGGGKRQNMVLRCAPTAFASCKALPVPHASDGSSVGPVQLLFESSNDYVVVKPGADLWAFTSAARLRRELFDATVTLEK